MGFAPAKFVYFVCIGGARVRNGAEFPRNLEITDMRRIPQTSRDSVRYDLKVPYSQRKTAIHSELVDRSIKLDRPISNFPEFARSLSGGRQELISRKPLVLAVGLNSRARSRRYPISDEIGVSHQLEN